MHSNSRSSPVPPANQSTDDLFNTEEANYCETHRYWHVFLASSLITFFVLLLLVLGWKLLAWIFRRHIGVDNSLRCPGGAALKNDPLQGRGQSNVGFGWFTQEQKWADELITGRTTTGRILVRKTSSCKSHMSTVD